ncbi:IS110 family transposase [Amycolatopsis ultiminotia]|uniref:IS110 family transposase n=1 Tax=Amycolatopsis ultiminotia TaxID=543629 RepID=UPI003CD0BF31
MSHPPAIGQGGISLEVILGVDTHKDIHVAAFISSHGALLGSRSFPTTAEGYRGLLDWATALGRVRQAGVEGTHSSGATLTRHLLGAGIGVIEVNQPDKAHRRRRGTTGHHRRRSSSPSGPVRPSCCPRQGRRRPRRMDPPVQAGQSLRHQITDAGDQPAQGHPSSSAPDPLCVTR